MAQAHLRIFGYITTLVLHITNLTVMGMGKEELAADLQIKVFQGMMYRYFTCWTVMLQIIYAALGLYCDMLILKNSNKKKYQIPGPLKGFRNILFSALVWPCTMVVFTVFWSLFLYDRNLIFPEFIDKAISSTSNHILHTVIVAIVLWEVLFMPRTQPRSHLRNIIHLAVHMAVYLSVLYYTYIRDGIWLYPIFKVTYGTIHFFLLHVYIGILFLLFYYLQWFLSFILHGSRKVESNKVE